MLETDYQKFIGYSRYSRYKDDEKRREHWGETVKRYFDFLEGHLKDNLNYGLSKHTRKALEDAVLGLSIMPSMRALATAGTALDRDNTAGYNCSYLPINHPRSFDELFYILLCGAGVGYSVERDEIKQLPEVNEHFEDSKTLIIAMLYVGQIPQVGPVQDSPCWV
jgi:ribonucleoside-diphosphate reductase alpha chain